MKKNSNKRRKKFASKQKKTRVLKTPLINPYWEEVRLRQAIISTAWYVVDRAMDVNINTRKQPDWVPTREHIKKTLLRGYDIDDITEWITGYSPLSDEWDDKFDNHAPHLRGEMTQEFFEVKKLLEETIDALIYLLIGKVRGLRQSKRTKIEKETIPYKTMVKHTGNDECFNCRFKDLQRMSEEGAKDGYLYSEMRIATETSRTTRAISNHRLYIDEKITKEMLDTHPDLKTRIEKKILACVRLLLSPHLLRWSDGEYNLEATEHILALQNQPLFAEIYDLEDVSDTYNAILDKENKDYLRLYVISSELAATAKVLKPTVLRFFNKDD